MADTVAVFARCDGTDRRFVQILRIEMPPPPFPLPDEEQPPPVPFCRAWDLPARCQISLNGELDQSGNVMDV
jgi:hypothetical protein